MTTLGNKYFYIALLLILIFVIAVTIANIAYFYTAQKGNSKNLLKSQSEQLVIINSVVTVLLFLSLFAIGYMLFSKSKIDESKELTSKIQEDKTQNIERNFEELNKLNEDQQRRNMTKESMVELARELKKPQIEIERENKRLKNEILKMNTRLEQLTKVILSFKDNNKSLQNSKKSLETQISEKQRIIDQKDEELSVRRDVEIQRHDTSSVFNDGSSGSSVSSISSVSSFSSNISNDTNVNEQMSDISNDTNEITDSRTNSISYTEDDIDSLNSRTKSGELSNRNKDLHITNDSNVEEILDQEISGKSKKLQLDDSHPLYAQSQKLEKLKKEQGLETSEELQKLKMSEKLENQDEPSYNYGISTVKIPTQKQSTYTPFEYRMTPTNSVEEVKYNELIKTPALSPRSSKIPKSPENEYKPFIASFI